MRNTELISHHQPEEFGKGKKETPHVQPPLRILLVASILAEQCVCHQEGLCVRVIGQRQPRNFSFHHKIRDCESRGRAVLLGSLTLPVSAQAPFAIKSLVLSASVSPQTIHFRVLDKNPLLGPGRGPPSCNRRVRSD